ncbi:MAG: molybdopterin-dependent oxidoreductase, partial [Myxococcota bacterium]|nr:molybdopterin-dependent oxidoreductase [Myxococcota bacterium]
HWGRVVPFLTEQSAFYNRFDAKQRDPIFWWYKARHPELIPTAPPPLERWSLRFEGEVIRELEVDEAALRSLAEEQGSVSLLKTLRCSGDGPGKRHASNAVWTGVPLARVLEGVGVKPSAKRVRIHGEDGFTTSLRLSHLEDRGGRPTLLAFAINGQPMEHNRGGPVRLVVPDRYGFKNIKWIRRAVFTADDSVWGNHEVAIRAGTDDGLEALGSKILTPDLRDWNPSAETRRRDLTLRGVALGGQSPVAKVEVRIDEGPWQLAALEPPEELTSDPVVRQAVEGLPGAPWPLVGVWTPWSHPWTAPGPGNYAIRVRVTNTAGEVQQETDNKPIDGWSEQAFGRIVVS